MLKVICLTILFGVTAILPSCDEEEYHYHNDGTRDNCDKA